MLRADGRTVRLRDIARVELGALSYSTNSFLLRKSAVALLVTLWLVRDDFYAKGDPRTRWRAVGAFLGLLAVIMLSVAIAYFVHMTGLDLAWCFLIVFLLYALLAGGVDRPGMDLAALSRMFGRLTENHAKRMVSMQYGTGEIILMALSDVLDGIDAAADMAMAKFVFRSLAREHSEPGDFLSAANEIVLTQSRLPVPATAFGATVTGPVLALL